MATRELLVESTLDRTQHTVVISLYGEITKNSVPVLSSKVEEAAAQGCPNAILEMREVRFIDSVGLGGLLGISRRLSKDHRGTLRLVDLTPPVRAIFTSSRLELILPIYDDINTAVASL